METIDFLNIEVANTKFGDERDSEHWQTVVKPQFKRLMRWNNLRPEGYNHPVKKLSDFEKAADYLEFDIKSHITMDEWNKWFKERFNKKRGNFVRGFIELEEEYKKKKQGKKYTPYSEDEEDIPF